MRARLLSPVFLVALSLVYFGIRHFRDRLNHGALTLGQGIRIGLGISLITALAFGLLDVIYVVWLNPDFMETYYQNVLSELQATLPESEFLRRKEELEAQKALFASPLMNFILMAVMVLMIGVVITLLSTLILRRKASDLPS